MAAQWCQLEEQKRSLAEELAEPKAKKKVQRKRRNVHNAKKLQRGALAKLVGEKATLEEDQNVPKFAYSLDGEQLSLTGGGGVEAPKPSTWWLWLGLWPF